MATSATSAATRPPGRTPRLRVVAADQEPTPRHRAFWTHAGHRLAVEVITEAEWDAMHPSMRPSDRAVHLPCVGYVTLEPVAAHEADEIEEERRAAKAHWWDQRQRVGC